MCGWLRVQIDRETQLPPVDRIFEPPGNPRTVMVKYKHGLGEGAKLQVKIKQIYTSESNGERGVQAHNGNAAYMENRTVTFEVEGKTMKVCSGTLPREATLLKHPAGDIDSTAAARGWVAVGTGAAAASIGALSGHIVDDNEPAPENLPTQPGSVPEVNEDYTPPHEAVKTSIGPKPRLWIPQTGIWVNYISKWGFFIRRNMYNKYILKV